MSSENHPYGGNPDFTDFYSDIIRIYADPDSEWQKQWGKKNADLGERILHLIETVIHSHEGLSNLEVDEMRQALTNWPDMWEWSVDWWYCKDALDRIPEVIRRFKRLAPVLAETKASAEVALYIREATRCYLFGLFQGSTALCRVAVETSLNEHIERKLGHVPQSTLSAKVDRAATLNLISAATAHMAHEVIDAGNEVLHEKPTKEGRAFNALTAARGVLKDLYEANS